MATKSEKGLKKKEKKNNFKAKKNSTSQGDSEKKLEKEDEVKNSKKRAADETLTKQAKSSKEVIVALPPGDSKVLGALLGGLENTQKDSKETQKEEDIIQRPLKWHNDEISCSQLCHKCLLINYRWPPRPRVCPTPDKDPNLIYPGDVDPNFKPSRGDILIVHPRGLGLDPKPPPDELWWKSKRIGGGYCICYDGNKNFKFEVGDVMLRLGSYVDPQEEMDMELEGAKEPEEGKGESKKPEEGKSKSKGKRESKIPKPRKIADPPQLDPVNYKPFEKVELYICSGFVVVKEEVPLNLDPLNMELKRVFEANTEYTFSMDEKEGTNNPNNNNNLKRKSIDNSNPNADHMKRKSTDNGNPNADYIKRKSIDNSNPIAKNDLKKKSILAKEKNTNKLDSTIKEIDANNDLLTEKIEAGRKKSLRSIALEASQASQRKLESQEDDTKTKPPDDKNPPKINLIWTFLGSQSQLQMKSETTPVEEPKCPGLGCFYQPYLNLGSSCKMEHTPVPNLGEILIPEGVWMRNFNHRKNEWRSLVSWYVPPMPPMPKALEGEVILDNDPPKEEVAPEPDLQMGQGKRKKSSKEKGDKGKDKEEIPSSKEDKEKGKADKGDLSKSDEKVIQGKRGSKIPDATSKDIEKIQPAEQPAVVGKADKAVQVPHIEEPEPEPEILDFPGLPDYLKKKLVPGMILIRPLVGRQLEEELAPVEEWKWPRKKKIWGSVEMYMVEWGGEGLGWVFWGKSERICDTAYPLPPPGAKLKFLHPTDAKIEVPINPEDQTENVAQVEEVAQIDEHKGDRKKSKKLEISGNEGDKSKENKNDENKKKKKASLKEKGSN